MNVEHINPFIRSAEAVFQTMLDCELTKTGVSVKNDRSPRYEVSGVIGLSGKAIGCVVFTLSRDFALKVAEIMLGSEFDTVTEDVVDAVGELTNMIAGGAKAELAEYELSLGLPTVIVGRNHSVEFSGQQTPISVEFDTAWAPVALEVGIRFPDGDSAGRELAATATA